MTAHLYPTRHGDWHVIDGELVDLSEQKTPAPAESSVLDTPIPAPPAPASDDNEE